MNRIVAVMLAASLLVSLPRQALAEWPAAGTQIGHSYLGSNDARMFPDVSGGLALTWQQYSIGWTVRYGRLTADGVVMWTGGSVTMATEATLEVSLRIPRTAFSRLSRAATPRA
jgi:hypothetical protein